ncbi:hypothetical protein M9Y10_038038 [Tritrichomonas musculus]|uniref:Protein kinase domain-containing protein n=1 Tax=Tritrichomonas musculus TaxID=1915356 RepID=A0ABR2K7A2_9EUKA
MKISQNQPPICIVLQNNALKIQRSSREYENSKNFYNTKYTKVCSDYFNLSISQKSCTVHISNIINEIKNLRQYISNIPNNNFIENNSDLKIAYLNSITDKAQNISNKLHNNFNFGNINNFSDYSDKLQRNIKFLTNKEANESSEQFIKIIEEITNCIKFFNDKFNHILGFICSLNDFYSTIVSYLKNLTKLLDEIYRKQQNLKYIQNDQNSEISTESILITSYFIDEKLNAILTFSQKTNDEVYFSKEQTSLKNYIPTTNGNDIRQFLSKDQVTQNQDDEIILTIANSIIEGIKDNFEIDFNCIFNFINCHAYYRSIFYRNWLGLITKANNHLKQENGASTLSLDGIIDEFGLNENSIKNGTFDDLKDMNIEYLIESYKKDDTFFYFDFVYRTVMKHIFDQKVIQKKMKDEKISLNKINHIQEVKQFNEPNSTYKLCFDDEFYFILQKEYGPDIADELRNEEIRIMADNYSKFIVHAQKAKDEKLYMPYYPNGTLFSLYSLAPEKRVKLSFVDKIAIIIEIATALESLHSHDEYHGNLSSQSIYIDSSKDAYLGSICYDRENERSNTVQKGPYFYRPPEDLVYNENNKDKKEPKSVDIYSFGVLMHEIITEISPNSRMKGKKSSEINQHLEGNYSGFLFSGPNNEYFNEDNYKDDDGNSFKGMKEIIGKCMEKDIYKRYSSFEEIIESLKALPIYTNNKKEIDFRFDNARDADKYQCTISNLVESYYRGQAASIDDIKQFLTKYLQLFPSTELQKKLSDCDESNDVIQMIISLFWNNQPVDCKFEESKPKENYSIDNWAHCALNTIFKQDNFIRKFQEALEKSKRNPNVENYLPDTLRFNELTSSYKIFFDKELYFYLLKTYNLNVSKRMIDREKRIFESKYSKFIVQSIKTNNIDDLYEDENKLQEKPVILPYFPIGTFESLMVKYNKDKRPGPSKSIIKLTHVDKIVMIYEIATAMKDLHSHNEYHGNLSSQFIFINSSKDAYLGSFCYDRSLEMESTKPRGPFYYRSPEILENEPITKADNLEDEEYVKLLQQADIYAFGVLMHEIITETSPERRMGNRQRDTRLKILKGYCNIENEKYPDKFQNYSDFLFKEGSGNEVFEDNYKDEEGNSFQGMKEIIEKCMKKDINERYSSFEELIGCIEALPIYTNNKEEIEFRIKNATDAREYQCTISDLVESYYRGQTASKDDIEQLLSIYQEYADKSIHVNNIDVSSVNYFSLFEEILQAFDLKVYSLNRSKSIYEYYSEIVIYLSNVLSLSIDQRWSEFFIRAKAHAIPYGSFFMVTLKEIFDHIWYLNGSLILKKANDEFREALGENFTKYNIGSEENIEYLLDLLYIDNKFFYLDFFYHIFLKCLIDQEKIDSNFQAKIKDLAQKDPFVELQINGIDSSYKIFVDSHLHFILQKEIYRSGVADKEREREKMIMTKNYSKFIVHADIDGKEKINIPYYPNGTLNLLLNERSEEKVKFTSVDENVMILEIATALNDLHSHNEYHGNLSDQSIFIDSTKDAYLGLFFNDRNNGRTPEKFGYNDDCSKGKMADIYSFAVLVNEITNNISSEVGMRRIIEKCMKKDINERYSSFEEIIEALKELPIYTNNKKEIDFRISHARDAREYKCTISDLVESYYRGQAINKSTIEQFLSKYQQKFQSSKSLKKSSEPKNASNIIQCIISVLIPNPLKSNIWNKFFSVEKYHFSKPIINDLIDSVPEQCIPRAIKAVNDNKTENNPNIEEGQEKNEITQNGKYFLLDVIGHYALKEIISQDLFIRKFQEALEKSKRNPNVENYLPDTLRFNELTSSYKIFFDKELYFYLLKTYNLNVSKRMIDREKRIFESKYSKFIVQSIKTNNINEKDEKENQENVVILPYFPIGTFESLIVKYNKDKRPGPSKSIIKLTHVDKIVMIYEIATAMKDLYSHNEYHGNLSSQFIFINSSKDAYLGSFCYDRSLETESTKPRGPFYYRSPEILENEPITKADNLEDEEYVKLLQQADIYAFGVLMHEIITETSPERRMGNRPRDTRLKILKGYCNIENQKNANNGSEKKDKNTKSQEKENGDEFDDYCDFLFKEGGGNEVFEDDDKEKKDESIESQEKKSIYKFMVQEKDFKDDKRNSFQGMKEIIEKCMKKDINERYSSFKELIGCIEALPIYTNNKEEIEFRIKHAIDAREYQCTISDLVESYYRGQTASKDDIEQFLEYQIIMSQENSNIINAKDEDILDSLFTAFDINNSDENFSQYFEDILNLIITKIYHKEFSRNQSVVDEEDYLLKLSREANFDEEEEREIIIPVCSLGSFIENNGNRIEEGYSLTFLYFIAKDLSLIHSNNLYHGELTADHIGLYYNHETRTLIPLVIPYYYYYKNNQNSMNTEVKIPSKMYSSKELVSKEQRKDIKNFIKIAMKLGISDEILSKIQESETMNEIVYHLSYFIKHNPNKRQLEIFEKNKLNSEYSSFVITYPIIEKVFHHIKDKKYSFSMMSRSFKAILVVINEFISNALKNPEMPIKSAIDYYHINPIENEDEVPSLFEEINANCLGIIELTRKDVKFEVSSILEVKDTGLITIRKKPVIKSVTQYKYNAFRNLFDAEFKLNENKRKVDNLRTKPVYKTLEFIALYERSFEFLLTRFILNLNPFFKYRVRILFNSPKKLQMRYERITLDLVKKAANIDSRLSGDVDELENGGYQFYLKAGQATD